MECRDVRSLADSYLSEQLLVETTQAVVEHLERCQACRAEFDGRRRLRATLRSAFERAPDLQPRPEFLDVLHENLRVGKPPIRGRAPRWGRGLALAAGVVLTLGLGAGGVLWVAQDAVNALAQLAAGDHQNCALKFRLPERPLTLTEAGARFDPAFGRLETLQVAQEALRHGPIQLVERHACVYKGQLFAHVVLRYGGSTVSVLVADAKGSRAGWWQGAAVHGIPPAGGFNLASFRSARHRVFVVSTLPSADVRDVAQVIARPLSDALGGL